MVGEFAVGPASAAREDEDGLADRMRSAAIEEFPILHWREQMSQPAQRSATQRGVALVEEDKRYFTAQRDVAHEVKGFRELFRLLKKREVKRTLLNLFAVSLTLERFGDLLDAE